ncbi:hypothetical protein EV715DRAFT_295796 [Schizophyllum commune]
MTSGADTSEKALHRTLSGVSPEERWWVEHRPWLESSGYLLRPRFQPGWEPSWHDPKVELLDAEDQYPALHPDVLDATRLSDGVSVMLKRVDRRQHPDEVEITALLSSPPLSSDPRNHCIPLFDVLEVPDNASMRIMVLPLLRRCADPRFDTVGEVVDCLQQILECMQFLHEKKITHRDFHLMNIMMNADPLYTVPFHPVSKNRRRDWKGYVRPSYTRTERPVQYHIIDFGLSIKYDSVDPPPMEIPVLGGDKSLPEFVGDDPAVPFSGLSKPYNPFPADVYCVGSWIRGEFLVGNIRSRLLGLDFLWPLVNEMTEKDPQKRPTMDQVMSRYKDVVSSLSSWKLRSRVAKARDNSLHSLYLSVTHWARRVRFVASKRPAIPSYIRD